MFNTSIWSECAFFWLSEEEGQSYPAPVLSGCVSSRIACRLQNKARGVMLRLHTSIWRESNKCKLQDKRTSTVATFIKKVCVPRKLIEVSHGMNYHPT